jgi:DNA-binding beta-propeller fold protein YncE
MNKNMLQQADKTLSLIFLLLVVVISTGCTAPQITNVYKEPLTDQGKLYFYLHPLPQEMKPLSFIINEIKVIPEQGEAIPILTTGLPIKGSELVGRQKKLATEILPPGRYNGVSLNIERAGIDTEEGVTSLLPPDGPVRVELSFTVLRGRSLALFLVLSPEYLVTDGSRFTPRFALGRPFLPPRNYMGFISHANENMVTIFNKRTMEVVQVIQTGAGPQGMVLDQRKGIVYVAIAGDDIIQLISLTTMEIIGSVRLSSGDEPMELALTPDGKTLISANYGSNTVSIIDTRSISERERLSIDPDPVWIVAGKDGKRAFVLHALAGTLSVVDLGREIQATSVSIDESPLRGTLSSDGNSLYIISQYSTDLVVVDARSLVVKDRIHVGTGSSAVRVDPKTNLIYVAKLSGEIIVLDPAVRMFIDRFRVDPGANFITIDGEDNTLLVLSSSAQKVRKFNLVNRREVAEAEAEGGAHALVIMGEL